MGVPGQVTIKMAPQQKSASSINATKTQAKHK
jgi:hypothetical protein